MVVIETSQFGGIHWDIHYRVFLGTFIFWGKSIFVWRLYKSISTCRFFYISIRKLYKTTSSSWLWIMLKCECSAGSEFLSCKMQWHFNESFGHYFLATPPFLASGRWWLIMTFLSGSSRRSLSLIPGYAKFTESLTLYASKSLQIACTLSQPKKKIEPQIKWKHL